MIKKGGQQKVEAIPNNLKRLIERYELLDIWRIQHPDLSRFTYRQKTPLIQSRLDFFLVSNILEDLIVSTEIIPSVWSDHSAIVFKL